MLSAKSGSPHIFVKDPKDLPPALFELEKISNGLEIQDDKYHLYVIDDN